MGAHPTDGKLLAISDLHVSHPENQKAIAHFRPKTDSDWLILCGNVSEPIDGLDWMLGLLTARFEKLIWVPGNHELWTSPDDDIRLRREMLYQALLDVCTRHGVLTPEDDYPIWHGKQSPVIVAPLFLLYDYSFGRSVASTKERLLALAHKLRTVCNDEFLLHPHPHATREHWCRARIEQTLTRLLQRDDGMPTVLVNHWPLIEAPTKNLRHRELAIWCGTSATTDWHRRFAAVASVYGHLHIPRTTWRDGVRFEEVSMGYPREWQRWGFGAPQPREILVRART